MKSKFLILAGLVLAATLSRLLPHPWNWTAVGAAALFAGAKFERSSEALVVAWLGLFLGDLVLGFHDTMLFTYGALALTVLVGRLGREKLTGWRVGVGAGVTSLIFFLVTNFGVWLMGGFYPPTGAGLVTCFIAGLPFLASQMMGDLFYSALLFGLGAYAVGREPVRAV